MERRAGIVATIGGRRDPSVHLETVRRRHGDKVYEQHLLRSSYREGGKVKHRTLGNVSHLPSPVIEVLRRALKGEQLLPASETFEVVRTLPHGHVAAVLGTARRLGLERLLDGQPSPQRELVLAMVAARVLHPASKLATARGLREETEFSSLGEMLQVRDVNEDDLYAALDWLVARQGRIEHKLAKRHLRNGCMVFYDLTSSYYTGSHCPLVEFGYNRDGKRRFPQIAWGLLCDAEGRPLAVEVFKGNVGDSKTLSSQIKKVQKRFGVERVVMVGDRGMITQARIREDLSPVKGLDWITALRAPAIQALAQQGVLQLSLFDERDLAEIISPDYPGERLIACRNPLLAEERAKHREELLRATEKELNKIVAATKRKRARLAGKEGIGLKVGKVLNQYKVGKHFKLRITDESFEYERATQRIAAEAALDGIYIIRSSVAADRLSAEDTVRAYKDLAAVERAFRSLKSVDLKVRPFYHHLEGRVKGHIFLCLLAYYVEWHMRQALAPILFDDGDREAAQARRGSVVAPAQRSPAAENKAQTKRTAQGEPVHSFQTLLLDLATVCKSTIVFKVPRQDAPVFQRVTTPTPLQQRAFQLLGVALA